MNGPEKRYFEEFRDQTCWPYIERIENRVNLGTPDTHFATANKRGWLEFKAEPRLKPQNFVGLSKEQMVWHLSYAGVGGCSWITLRAGAMYFLWSGVMAKRLRDEPIHIMADETLFWGEKDKFYQLLRGF